jgi:hypothetical protein
MLTFDAAAVLRDLTYSWAMPQIDGPFARTDREPTESSMSRLPHRICRRHLLEPTSEIKKIRERQDLSTKGPFVPVSAITDLRPDISLVVSFMQNA